MPEPFLSLLDRQATIRGRDVVFTFTDATEAAAALAEAREAAARGEKAIAIVFGIAATMEEWGKAVLVDGEGTGKEVFDLADEAATAETERAMGMPHIAPNRSPRFRDGARWAVRRCIAWLHARAGQMNDPHARALLNSAAFGMGHWKRSALEDAPDPVDRQRVRK